MKNRSKVLIVDDEALNRSILKKFLSDSYDIIEATDGALAWAVLTEKHSELAAVLLDIKMPVMDGYELLAKMDEAHINELPVIVTTASADESTEQKALDAGAWDFITKPFNPKILMSRLKNAVARSRIASFEKVQYLSEHDELTGLYNRRKMFFETQNMLNEHPNESFVFIRLDIDHFALFNTSFGEREGDALLKFVAQRITEAVSDCRYAVYGRMNADVFCIAASCAGKGVDAGQKLGWLQEQIGSYRKDYRLKISAGICHIEDRTQSVDDFYLYATMAAQHCKNMYDINLAFYDESAGRRLASELAITAEMQQAIDKEQFVIYLQPKFTLSTDSVCGAEALVRWLHPQKGLIPPGNFIPVFERNGFISKLDYYVWEKTCQLLRDWISRGMVPFPVSVNISRISLYNPQLTQQIIDLTAKYDIPRVLFQLEITESAYMSNPDLMKKTIASLHEAGFTILMDDFGSEYSSLNTLKDIDVDVLKVDMKFLPVRNETGRAEVILACVIKMANWLGLSVVVEGVETRRQRDFLEGAGCDCVQGYYFSRPIPSKEYTEKYLTVPEAVQSADDGGNGFEGAPLHNMTILIIDDNEFDRAILQANFHSLYNLHMCDSAETALAYLKRNMSRVRLILVDNIMPGMSGLEFLRYCRQYEELDAIPKIMITASDTVADQVEAFNSGAYDYITKPLIKEIVVARVNHVMQISCHTTVFDQADKNGCAATKK